MSVTLLVVIVLIVLLLGAAPLHSYSAGWGYYPSGILGVILVIFLLLWLVGRI